MLQKYNIALIPLNKSIDITRLAAQFHNYHYTYILGKYSLPHVTLCHFRAEDQEISVLWKKAYERVLPHTIDLEFQQFSIMKSSKKYWVSLLPKHQDTLQQMH